MSEDRGGNMCTSGKLMPGIGWRQDVPPRQDRETLRRGQSPRDLRCDCAVGNQALAQLRSICPFTRISTHQGLMIAESTHTPTNPGAYYLDNGFSRLWIPNWDTLAL
jgi:hypothetical protein